MQRRILERLGEARDTQSVPRMCWWDAHALGVGFSSSENSSFRRAARTLIDAGTLEERYVLDEVRPLSESAHYRIRRGLRPRPRAESFAQGSRRRLVIRLTATADDRATYEREKDRAIDFLIARDPGPFATKYREWWWELPPGIYHDDEWDPEFGFEPRELDVNEESAAELAATGWARDSNSTSRMSSHRD